jgi:hypothetical protein
MRRPCQNGNSSYHPDAEELSGARLIELKLSSEITGWQAVVVEETT